MEIEKVLTKMEIIPAIKDFFQEVPLPMGKLLAQVPYDLRPGMGKSYRTNKKRISEYSAKDVSHKKSFILSQVIKSVKMAMNIPFYCDLYRSHGIKLDDLIYFEDIQKLPIITKEMLRDCPLAYRTCSAKGRYLVNTGGSSGSTLDFYITPSHIPVEWAHMHTIWESLGFKQSDLKLNLGGRNLILQGLKYDGLRHQYVVNTYKGFEEIVSPLREVVRDNKIRYLHGYPSTIAEFANRCQECAPDIVDKLRESLRGAFLSSEFPAEIYRRPIERIFGIPTVSWYGHTERAILAWEKEEKYEYFPFQTYGYCEVVPNVETGGWKLLGTSYSNQAAPFIRYDTGDDVEPVKEKDGLLVSFRIRNGRNGDFILDREGNKISLTALVYGRHHKIFNIAKSIQIKQPKQGCATVILTLKDNLPDNFIFSDWFDLSGINMDINLEIVEKPILSSGGKVLLRVPSSEKVSL